MNGVEVRFEMVEAFAGHHGAPAYLIYRLPNGWYLKFMEQIHTGRITVFHGNDLIRKRPEDGVLFDQTWVVYRSPDGVLNNNPIVTTLAASLDDICQRPEVFWLESQL